MSGRLVLAMDGATATCSAALLRTGESADADRPTVVARRSQQNGRGQARILLRLIDEMLEEIGSAPTDIGSIVVGTGPGTFTGVRIAVATARGLSLALDVPVFGVSTLTALAAYVVDGEGGVEQEGAFDSVVAVIDARRQQVFFAEYVRSGESDAEGAMAWRSTQPIGVCGRGELPNAVRDVRGSLAVVGEDAELAGTLPVDARFVRCEVKAEYLVLGREWLPEPAQAGIERMPGRESGSAGSAGSPESVRPIYVRPPDADMHIKKMKDPWA